jgi:tungstate transport system permease protein
MILAQTVIALPLLTGITMAAVAAVPAELVLQVRSLGASPWQVRWTVVREARAGILVALAAGFGRIISEVGAAMIVGGNIQDQTRVLTTAIVLETSKGQFALALALGGWLLGLTLLVNLLMVRLYGRPVS